MFYFSPVTQFIDIRSDLKFYTKSVKQVCLIKPVSEDIVAFLREPVNVEESVACLSPILKITAITALIEVSQKRYGIKNRV